MIPKRRTYSGQSYKIYEDYNVKHIFVEDLGFENLYKVIFERYGLQVRQVFSSGGKIDVIKAAIKCKEPKCFFLVDRDWDDIIKKDWNKYIGDCGLQTQTKVLTNILDIEHMYRNIIVTEKHSIENYLIDYSGFRGIILSENPRNNISELIDSKKFDFIVNKIADRLRPLFECFIALQIYSNDKNCSKRPGYFQEKNNSGYPDLKKITSVISESNVTVSSEIQNYLSSNRIKQTGHGKYLLHFIWQVIKQTYNLPQLKTEKLMIRLAQIIDVRVFDDFCKKIM